VQEPLLHESAVTGSHAMQAPPPAPHACTDGVLHVLPEQQPDRHVWAHPEQTPPTHDSPPAHAAHAEPAIPHALDEGVVHVLPLQQPFGHDAALHTQAPFTQA
jgi:hypothetical protein